jgi:transcriptional regulator with XRE-family HTH domain
MVIARWIRFALTQGQLAQLIGVHPLTVWKWEQGRARPTPHQAALLESFVAAQRAEPDAGALVVGTLFAAGVAAALYVVLKAAFRDDDRGR